MKPNRKYSLPTKPYRVESDKGRNRVDTMSTVQEGQKADNPKDDGRAHTNDFFDYFTKRIEELEKMKEDENMDDWLIATNIYELKKAQENLSQKGKSGDTHGASAMQGSSGEDSVFSREELVKPSDTILLKDFDKFIAELKECLFNKKVIRKEHVEIIIDDLARKVKKKYEI